MNVLRMFAVQTRMNFLWYFRRDGEMMFWTLAMPVFFLVLFSFAFSQGPSGRSATFLVPGIIGAQVLSSGFWGVGVMLATFREKHLLRRVYLTPMPRWIFFASLVAYRVTLLAVQAIILVTVGSLLFHVRITGNPVAVLIVLLLGTATFVSLGTIIPSLTIGTRRLHDTDRSGWWQLLVFVPLIGAIVLIVWYATAGTPGTNRFGPAGDFA